jgi:cytochrome c oxidase subunit 2
VTSEETADRIERRREGLSHWKWLTGVWLILTAIIEPVIYFLIWPHLPPGNMTSSARGAQFDMMVLTMIAAPVMVAVLAYFAYALIVFRHPKGRPLVDGPPLRGNLRVQTAWITITSAIVMGAFVFGTYELIVPAGAGGAEGPSPIWTPASHTELPVQVIGQQWIWTYRYPTFGGFETTQLMLPNNTEIAFHVTSLDVIHSFWAYQLGVKADANPGVDDVAFTQTNQLGRITVRCSELCGIWHGAMYGYGEVVSPSAFETWAKAMERRLAPATRLLPPFAWTYTPSANGAGGGYYPQTDPYYDKTLYDQGRSGPEGNLPALRVEKSQRVG